VSLRPAQPSFANRPRSADSGRRCGRRGTSQDQRDRRREGAGRERAARTGKGPSAHMIPDLTRLFGWQTSLTAALGAAGILRRASDYKMASTDSAELTVRSPVGSTKRVVMIPSSMTAAYL